MKKVIAIILCVIMSLFLLTACFDDNSGYSYNTDNGYSNDYNTNSRYKNSVDKTAGSYGIGSKEVDNTFQGLAGAMK